MTSHRLSDVLLPFLPANRTRLLEECIHALEALPGMGEWVPSGPVMENMIPFWEVLWGFPFTFLADVPSLDALRRQVGTCIGNGHWPEPSDMSEVNAAALAKALGAREIQCIEEEPTPTPDFRIWWESDEVEMEVTRAATKQSQTERSDAVSRLSTRIRSFGRPFDIIVHVADILRDEDCQEILHVAGELEPETTREKVGSWHVCAESPRRQGNYHVLGEQSDAAPEWWPDTQVARLNLLTQAAGGPAAEQIHPHVRIHFGTPIGAYINAAARKADYFQGSGEVPFVIAFDVTALPLGGDVLRRELPEYFKAWPRVSGVLLIQGPSFIVPRIGWLCDFIRNPCCLNKLPESMLIKMGDRARTIAYDLHTASQAPAT